MDHALGIDVSHHNSDAPKKPIDWQQVKDAGCSFAFIKCTEGKLYKDVAFDRNWEEAGKAGILRSPYHYWRSDHNAHEQAAYFRSKAPHGELPPMIDVEDPRLASGRSLEPALVPFLTAVMQLWQRDPLIYTYPYYFIERGNPTGSVIKQCKLFISNITKDPEPMLPKAWTTWLFWQFTWKSRWPGIVGDVDGDFFNGTVEALKLFAGLGPTPPAPDLTVELSLPKDTPYKVIVRS